MKINNRVYNLVLLSLVLGTLNSCATFHQQLGKDFKEAIDSTETNKELKHKFFLIGDAGNADESLAETNFKFIKEKLNQADKNATVLFLGDNIYQHGLPDTLNKNYNDAINKINKQLELVDNFKGNTIFIAGNHDWYSGLDGLIAQKNYVTEKLNNKKAFLPRKYEAIEKFDVNEDITLIVIDSEWFLQDWNNYNNINKESEIRNREDFFEEFRNLINKNQNKLTLVVIHHPMFTGGDHGGFFSFRKHIFPIKNIPLPIMGTMINYLRKTTGASPADQQYKLYQALTKRLTTIVKDQEQVIFLSGHDHNLQYIQKDGIKQIISGSGSKKEEARAVEHKSFSVGKIGYGILNVYDANETEINFFTTEDDKDELVFRKNIYKNIPYTNIFPEVEEKTHTTSIYSADETQKNAFYRFLFGKHYRSIYSIDVEAPVVKLDTLFGGLTPTISGGGNQSMSLRMVNPEGKEYVMRGVRKNAVQFLQSAVFKDVYVKDKFKETYVLPFVYDFYTTSHPYVPFIIGDLADAVQLYHTNPKLYYVPKQNTLGKFNENYGNELYMIEERPANSQLDAKNFGNPIDIVSTQDVLDNIEKDMKYHVDAQMYLRARIFDFLIGDWDRHADQWRWSEFKQDDEIIYRPIGRDRDQAFAKIDGKLLTLIKFSPALRHMQNYTPKFGRTRWLTKTAFPLDKVFLQNLKLEDWEKTADEVINSITDEVIDNAFANLPKEVQNPDSEKIKEILKLRRGNLKDFVAKYYNELLHYGLVIATNKENKLEVITSKNQVQVNVFHPTKKGELLTKTYTYDPKTTKEVWIYGLDDTDYFTVNGEKSPILLRLIGGKNHDTYEIASKNKVRIYDYKSEINTIYPSNRTTKILRDNYNLNAFDYRNAPLNTFTLIPDINYNKDNGFMLGFNANLKVQKFIYNPFSQEHHLKAKMDFATTGAIVEYFGKFKNNTRNWYFQLEASTTTSNFSQNFFGFGNETSYDRDLFKTNYNRVRTAQHIVKPSYNYLGVNGGNFLIGPTYETVKIINTHNRFVDDNLEKYNLSYKTQSFYGAQAKYEFENYDSNANPTLGLAFLLHYGFRVNTKEANENHSFVTSKLNVLFPLIYSKIITMSSSIYAKTMIGSPRSYNFYQAADLGSNTFLRGFRQNRFVGRTAFAQATDINFKISDWNSGLVPMTYGAFVGFDYGRVWEDYRTSKQWHFSYGGGIWITAIDSFTLRVNAFKSSEELMFTFGLGIGL